MELKHAAKDGASNCDYLLIVPYGIETGLPAADIETWTNLLIVPYGIETFATLFHK